MKTIEQAVSDLVPGAIIGYEGFDIVRWFTNGAAGHVAVYIGRGSFTLTTFTPDDSKGPVVVTADPTIGGVGFCALNDWNEIVWIRQPWAPLDLGPALTAIKPYLGQPYSWSNTLGDGGIWVPANGGLNCSHTSALVMAGGGSPQFDPDYNLAQIEPAHFETSYESTSIWTRPK